MGNSRYEVYSFLLIRTGKYNFIRKRYISDKNSIMNIGNQIRDRHIDYILLELNSLFWMIRNLF